MATRQHRSSGDEPNYGRRRLIAAAGASVVPLGLWWALRDSDQPQAQSPVPQNTSPEGEPVSASPTTAMQTPPPPASEPVAFDPIDEVLTIGMSGARVEALQHRLFDIAFDPGPIDGAFGGYTQQAVWAFEKLVLGVHRREATGHVTPAMWERMHQPLGIEPRRTNLSTFHVEVYLPEQVLVAFDSNVPVLIAHCSSGELNPPGDDFTDGYQWCEEVTISPGEFGNEDGEEPINDGRCGDAETPGGTYKFYRRVSGTRDSALGSLYDPIYFNYGIAVHGAQQVPLEPASHGCIRLNRYLGAKFNQMPTIGGNWKDPKGDDIWVWNGVEEPEVYGAKPGWFDWNWDEWDEENPPSTTAPPTTTPESTTPSSTTPPSSTTSTTSTTSGPASTSSSTTTTSPAPTSSSPPTSAPSSTVPDSTAPDDD